MIKLFVITFFIAELIIATSVILHILRLDKKINALDKTVSSARYKIRTFFVDFRFLIRTFVEEIYHLKEIIQKKREEYILNMLKTSLIYLGILSLKGKYKKTIVAYQFGKEIYEGIVEGYSFI